MNTGANLSVIVRPLHPERARFTRLDSYYSLPLLCTFTASLGVYSTDSAVIGHPIGAVREHLPPPPYWMPRLETRGGGRYNIDDDVGACKKMPQPSCGRHAASSSAALSRPPICSPATYDSLARSSLALNGTYDVAHVPCKFSGHPDRSCADNVDFSDRPPLKNSHSMLESACIDASRAHTPSPDRPLPHATTPAPHDSICRAHTTPHPPPTPPTRQRSRASPTSPTGSNRRRTAPTNQGAPTP